MDTHRRYRAFARAFLVSAVAFGTACDTSEPGTPLSTELRGADETADQRFKTRMGTEGATKVEIAPVKTVGEDKAGNYANADGAKLFTEMRTKAGIATCATDNIKTLTTTGTGGLGKYKEPGKSGVLNEKGGEGAAKTDGGERGTFGFFVRVTKGEKAVEYFALFSYDRIRYPDSNDDKLKNFCAFEVFVFGPFERDGAGNVKCYELVEGLAVDFGGKLLGEVPTFLADVKNFLGGDSEAVKPNVDVAGAGCLKCHKNGGSTAETKPFPWTNAKIVPKKCGCDDGGSDSGDGGEADDACDESTTSSGGESSDATGSDGSTTTGLDWETTTGWLTGSSDASSGSSFTGGSSSGGSSSGGSSSSGSSSGGDTDTDSGLEADVLEGLMHALFD